MLGTGEMRGVTNRPRVGLLPLYLKLYDDAMPERRAEFGPFLKKVAGGFEKRGIEVFSGGICRIAPEFERAVRAFEKRGVDCIVTVHLAYSPSLESIKALTETPLPVVIFDTTMDADFGCDVVPDRIMYNHGVHGVMDMANMLRRRGKAFEIVAGHVRDADLWRRAEGAVRAAVAARSFRATRALRVGDSFRGMGDFAVAESVMRKELGITVEQISARELGAWVRRVKPAEVGSELAADRRRFACACPKDVHERSVRVGLGLRKKLDAGGFSAFSMNFLAFDSGKGPVNTVPFLEASKAMARGIGYAGEGDVLTAALVGALARGFGDTTFTEIFCPDWKGNSLFLSHMGEINPDIAASRPRLIEKPFPWTAAKNPAVLTCAPRRGPAVFVDLAPGPGDTFTLIVAPVEILGDSKRADMKESVRGWIRPAAGVKRFLEEYSRAGGTHHSALVLGRKAGDMETFGAFAGLAICRI